MASTSTDSSSRTGTTPIALFLLIVLLWGSTWLAIKLQLGSVPPAVSVAYRFLLAAVCMFGWCLLRRTPMRFPLRTHLRFALVGLLQYCTNYVLFYYSSENMVSGLVSIVFALSVGCNILNGAIFLQRKVKPSVVVAALVGVAGLVLTFGKEIADAGGSATIGLGLLLGMAGTLSFSFGNIVSSRTQQAGVPVVPATAWSMAYGGILTTVGCLIAGQRFTFDFSLAYISGLVYLAVFGSAIAFVAYLTVLGQIGPERAAFATVMFPLVSLTLSTIFEGYHWTALGFLGVLLVLLSNAVILVGPQLRRLVRVPG